MPRWVSITPFGSPVVPDVNCTWLTASGSGARVASSVRAVPSDVRRPGGTARRRASSLHRARSRISAARRRATGVQRHAPRRRPAGRRGSATIHCGELCAVDGDAAAGFATPLAGEQSSGGADAGRSSANVHAVPSSPRPRHRVGPGGRRVREDVGDACPPSVTVTLLRGPRPAGRVRARPLQRDARVRRRAPRRRRRRVTRRLTLRYVAGPGRGGSARRASLDPDDLDVLVADALDRQGASTTTVTILRTS